MVNPQPYILWIKQVGHHIYNPYLCIIDVKIFESIIKRLVLPDYPEIKSFWIEEEHSDINYYRVMFFYTVMENEFRFRKYDIMSRTELMFTMIGQEDYDFIHISFRKL